MRVVVQRAKDARVIVDGNVAGEIGAGLLVLVGVTHEDTEADARFLAEKVAHLRVFSDEDGKMNLSVRDIGGSVLSVSQFTLYGDCRKGRRPNYMAAARPEPAEQMYRRFNALLEGHGVPVATGVFGADMDVTFTNWGPVTLIIDSR